MHFVGDINIGQIAEVVTILIVFFTAHTKNVSRIQDMQTKLDTIHTWFVANIVNRKVH